MILMKISIQASVQISKPPTQNNFPHSLVDKRGAKSDAAFKTNYNF